MPPEGLAAALPGGIGGSCRGVKLAGSLRNKPFPGSAKKPFGGLETGASSGQFRKDDRTTAFED